MADALLALALLLALGAAVELCIKVTFVCLLPLLLRLATPTNRTPSL